MLKRCLAAVLCLWMLFSCALAQEDLLASYMLPEGAEVFYLPMGEAPEVPEGLETMYALMQPHQYKGDLYLIQMQNGLALFSISGMLAAHEMTAEELLALWPRIAADLALENGVVSVDNAPECAQVEALGGMQVLSVRTRLACEDGLALMAECFAFCAGGGVTEMWAVYPDPEAPANAHMLAQLESDLADLAQLMDSLVFPGGSTKLLQGENYADPKGRFQMVIPAGSTVLTGDSTDEEIASLRARFVENNPEGADRMFDRFVRQLKAVDTTLVFTGDMQGVLRVTATPEQCLTGVQPEGLVTLAPTFQEVFEKEFDLSFCLEDDQRATISGEEHALLGYWLRMGEMDLQLDLMLCIHPASWMYEVDIYTAEGNQDVRSDLYAFASQSLIYTPPVNALE